MSINQFKKQLAKKYMLLIEAEEVQLTDQEREIIEGRIEIELDGFRLKYIKDNFYRLEVFE